MVTITPPPPPSPTGEGGGIGNFPFYCPRPHLYMKDSFNTQTLICHVYHDEFPGTMMSLTLA